MEFEMKDNHPSFENVLVALGLPGKFQMTQAALINGAQLITAFTTLSFVFMGHEPPHICNAVNETKLLDEFGLANDSVWLEYKACHISIYTNSTITTTATTFSTTTTTINENNNKHVGTYNQITEVAKIACPNGRNFSDSKDTSYISEWDLVCESKGIAELVQTIKMFSAFASGFTGTYLADRFGRRLILFWFLVAETVFETAVAFSTNIYTVMGLKLLTGFFDQSASCAYLILGMELMIPRYRQRFGVMILVSWVMEVILFCGIAFTLQNYSWRYLQSMTAISGVLSVGAAFVLKESARWLSATNRRERALTVLKYASKQNNARFEWVKQKLYEFWNYYDMRSPNGRIFMALRDKNIDKNIDEDIDENIEEKVDDIETEEGCEVNEKPSRGNFLTLIRDRRLRVVLFLMWFIRTTHNLTYHGLFLTSSKLPGNRFLTVTLMAFVEIPANFALLVMLNKMNRRTVLAIFLGLSTVLLMTSSLLLHFGDDSPTSNILSTILLIAGKFSISASFNVVYIITPEFFPTNIRSIGNGVCHSGAKIGAMLAPFSRPLFNIAKWAPGAIFTVMCSISLIMILGLPETKDRDLPNSVDDYKKQTPDNPKVNFED